jgi:energy-coupling factor transport system ATP-binding protein
MSSLLPLEITHLTFQYHNRTEPALLDVSLSLHPGELVLLAGSSGCGKTTLMRCINGLIPRTYRGTLVGDLRLYGQPTDQLSMAHLSQKVGTLLQDPERQIVSSHVFTEVAFGLENLGLLRSEIIQRIDDTLRYLRIDHLRSRETFQLSGGEKQKVALAGVLAMKPHILLLDEPLASLDPASAAESLELFRQLANDGMSILLVEHRVEDVLKINPDRVAYMDGGRIIYSGDAEGLMSVVDYHKIKLPAQIVIQRAVSDPAPEFKPFLETPTKEELVKFEHVDFRYAPTSSPVLKDIDFTIHRGDVIAILGHNGAGKTTLVKQTLGLLKPTSGRVLLEGTDTRNISVAQAAHTIGYVFQSPTQMLFAPTVEEELAFGPKNLKFDVDQIQENVDFSLRTVHMEQDRKSPPLALSFGQQKRVSIAAVLAMRSRILMMDEPTAGQDYWNYQSFMDSILQMPGFDAVLFITHDLDLALIYSNRILLINNGELAADGSPQEVLADEGRLRECRILPTSLLSVNRKYFSRTGKYVRAEVLAHLSPNHFS